MSTVWRLGYRDAPCDFPPRHLYGWHNRFDDPLRQYRTLYGAQQSITCLRELLADLRPNSKAIAEFEEVFTGLPDTSLPSAGVVSVEWRLAHVLVKARLHLHEGEMADIEQEDLRNWLHQKHVALLRTFGIKNLRINEISSRQRIITQNFSRSLYEKGHAGITFRSRVDSQCCVALFEGRAVLEAVEPPIPMTRNWPELVQVCGDYSLVLRPMA